MALPDYSFEGVLKATITVDFFAQQMKFLHDNGLRALLMNQLSFNPTKTVFYIKKHTFTRTAVFFNTS